MKVTCKKACFYNSRLYEVGMSIEIPKGSKIPDHFESESQTKKRVVKKKNAFDDDPKTLKEAQDRQKKTVTLG